MATLVGTAPRSGATVTTPRRTPGSRLWRWVRGHLVQAYAALALFYMFLPVAVVLLYSFNNPVGRYNTNWNGFTFDNWRHMCGVGGICASLKLSLEIGALATLGSTVLGTLIAFALVRHNFRGRSPINMLIFLPMATPEVVMGSSLLTLFVNFSFVNLGFVTVTIAHIMFDVSFVVVTVKARLQGLDPRLEQAAMDLYANPRQTFWRITFPLVAPGILAASLLAFSLSFDDFIITNFVSGNSTVTFPMFVWGAHLRGIPAQINVIGSMMFFVALGLTMVGRAISSRRR